ncbi:hypothetical protein IQ07DRAFT_640268 [Pyrenochaeta sp. DS3sAY3a]|nr:hypothetical protein IQ07DRAFT_640268 [Pyrenochaeta sp. DS3sAY3a]
MAQGYVYSRVDQIERANISKSNDYHESHLDTPGKASTQHPAFFNYLFVIFLIITSFYTGYYISPIASKPKTKAGQKVDQKDILRESTRDFLPPLPNRIERFVLNESFHEFPSEDVTAAWTALIPKGQGAINLPITNEYNNNVYNIAVFHSLHCLVL